MLSRTCRRNGTVFGSVPGQALQRYCTTGCLKENNKSWNFRNYVIGLQSYTTGVASDNSSITV